MMVRQMTLSVDSQLYDFLAGQAQHDGYSTPEDLAVSLMGHAFEAQLENALVPGRAASDRMERRRVQELLRHVRQRRRELELNRRQA